MIDVRDGGCPNDERLADWAEGRGNGDDRDAIAGHVAGCAVCADVVASVLAPDEGTIAARVREVKTPPVARRGRATRWAVAAAVLLSTAALAYAAIDVAATRARDALVARVTAALGQPVSVGRVGLAVRERGRILELRLREVRIGVDGITADDLAVQVPLASLVAGAPAVSRLVAVGPTIVIGNVGPAGSLGTHLGGANAVAAALATVPVEVTEGTVIVAAAGGTVRIEHVAGTTTPSDGRIAVMLAGTLAGMPVNVEGEVPTDDGGSLGINIAARQLPPGALPWGEGRISGTADLSMRITGTPRAPVIAGRMLVRDGRVRGWNPVPGALPGVDAFVALRVAAPELAASDLRFDELRLVFISTPDGWRIPRLFVANAALVAGASVEIGAAAALTGNGTVQLSAPVAAAVIAAAPALGAARDASETLTLPFTVAGSVEAPRIVGAPVASAAPAADAADVADVAPTADAADAP